MTQYFSDFADSPSFTERWHTTDGAFTFESTGLPTGATGGYCMKIDPSATSRYAVSWDTVGDPGDVDLQLLYRWQVDTENGTTGDGRGIICGSGGTTDEDAYFIEHAVSGAATNQYIAEYNSGTSNIIATDTSVTLSADTWYWTRFERISSSDTLRFKTWSGAIGDEPGAWDASTTDASRNTGWVALGSFDGAPIMWVDVIGVGTSGDAAPDEEPVIDETAGSDTILADDSGTDTVIWMETGSSDSLDAVITATEILAWSELTGSDTLLAIDSATEILAWLEIAGSDPVLIIDSGTDHLTHYELTGTDTILISESGFDAIGFLEITGSDTILVVDSAPTDILAWSEVSGTDTVLIVDSGTESFIFIPGNIPVEMRFLRSISTARVMILSGDSPPVSVTRLAPYVPVKIMRFR